MDNSEVIFDLIDFNIEGIDVYHHNGSLWLIFTEDKKWVFELTKDGTLWYNHYFFTNCFKYLSLDVIHNQHYITKWVENVIQNGVINTHGRRFTRFPRVENVIQNGVTNTDYRSQFALVPVENVIHNRVINTLPTSGILPTSVENVIQNGVINTITHGLMSANTVEHVLQNGVKL